ncbi:MAG: hypothetical protein ACYDGW_11995 [Vulcanimicrobiaceae bacterium]
MRRFLAAAIASALAALLFGCGGGGAILAPPPQPVRLSTSTMNFTALGASAAQPVTVWQSALTTAYAESDTCKGVATIAQTSRVALGTATYSVTPIGAGGCTATFTGTANESAVLTITSAPNAGGGVTANPSSLSFLAIGASYAQNLNVSQSNFTGAYSESDSCTGVVTVSVTSNSGGAAVYEVTPAAVGTCQITITGGSGKTATVGVTVTSTSVGGIQ